MSESSSNPSSNVDLGQKFALAQTATELLEVSAPYQRALLRMLAVCERDNIAPAPLVLSLAIELPAKYRDRVERLAEQLKQGVDVVDALDEIPVLPPSVELALRLANQNGTLPALNAALLARYSEIGMYRTSREESNWSKCMRLAGLVFVMTCLLAYLMINVVPESKSMLEEFGVELPSTLQLLITICDYAVKFWFLWLLPLIILLPFCFGAFRRYLRRWNPLIWRQHVDSPSVSRRRSLALFTQSGLSAKSGIEMILGIQPLRRLFKGLNQANDRIEKGQGKWESLAAEKIISKRDAEALALSTNADTQAWLLRWSATARQNRNESQAGVLTRIFIGVVYVALGILVFLACSGVFLTLINIMKSLQ